MSSMPLIPFVSLPRKKWENDRQERKSRLYLPGISTNITEKSSNSSNQSLPTRYRYYRRKLFEENIENHSNLNDLTDENSEKPTFDLLQHLADLLPGEAINGRKPLKEADRTHLSSLKPPPKKRFFLSPILLYEGISKLIQKRKLQQQKIRKDPTIIEYESSIEKHDRYKQISWIIIQLQDEIDNFYITIRGLMLEMNLSYDLEEEILSIKQKIVVGQSLELTRLLSSQSGRPMSQAYVLREHIASASATLNAAVAMTANAAILPIEFGDEEDDIFKPTGSALIRRRRPLSTPLGNPNPATPLGNPNPATPLANRPIATPATSRSVASTSRIPPSSRYPSTPLATTRDVSTPIRTGRTSFILPNGGGSALPTPISTPSHKCFYRSKCYSA